MREDNVAFVALFIVVIMLSVFTGCSYFHMRYATELYCQSTYFNSVVKYEQCRHKDIVKLLKEEQVVKGE